MIRRICNLITGKRPAHIEVFLDLGVRARVRLRASNGEILMSSEAYDSLSNAKRAAERLSETLGVDWIEVPSTDEKLGNE